MMSVTESPLLDRNRRRREDLGGTKSSIFGVVAKDWGRQEWERPEGSGERRAKREAEEQAEEKKGEGEEERTERVEARAASRNAISSSLTISTGTYTSSLAVAGTAIPVTFKLGEDELDGAAEVLISPSG